MNIARLGALLFVMLLPSLAFAGGWTQSEGASYAKVWGTGKFGSNAFDLEGDVVPAGKFSLASLSAYGEYGLRPDLTLVGGLRDLGAASFEEQTRGYLGGVFAGFRQRFVSDPLNVALEARFGGSPGFGGERDLAPNSEFEFRPAVRTYFTEWELQLGVPIGTVGWFTLGAGPKWSTNPDLDPALIGSAQLGFGPFAGFTVDAHFNLNHTFSAPEFVNITGASDTRYLGVGIGVTWWIVDSFGVNIAGDSALFAKSNAGTPSLQLGVQFRHQ